MKIVDEIRGFAASHPDHPALILDGGENEPVRDVLVSYQELMTRVDQIADELRSAGTAAGFPSALRSYAIFTIP